MLLLLRCCLACLMCLLRCQSCLLRLLLKLLLPFLDFRERGSDQLPVHRLSPRFTRTRLMGLTLPVLVRIEMTLDRLLGFRPSILRGGSKSPAPSMACAGSAIELALENAPDQQRLSEMELLHERSTEENAGVTGISARPLTRSTLCPDAHR